MTLGTNYDLWRTRGELTAAATVIERRCNCPCDHTQPCDEGCLPANDPTPAEFDEWTCVGGWQRKLYDPREEA